MGVAALPWVEEHNPSQFGGEPEAATPIKGVEVGLDELPFDELTVRDGAARGGGSARIPIRPPGGRASRIRPDRRERAL